MDTVFTALASASRRQLMDALYAADGQTLSGLCASLSMTRQAVSKHLAILEEAELVVTVWKGREKYHYLNPVPLQAVYERWLRKFDAKRLEALVTLKQALEENKEKEDGT